MAQPALYKRAWSIRLLSISARVLAAVFAGLFLVGPGLHAQQGVSEKEGLGVLQRCLQCHGPALQMSKLNLSTREGMLQGGDHGVALVPGNAEESLIYKRITGQVKPAMPLAPVPALTNDEIAAVRDWINAGAPMSSGQTGATNENKADDASLLVYGNYRERTITDVDRQWWALKKPVAKEAPRVNDARWNKNPIDAFVRAKQEEKGLTPAPMADRNTLIRRAYLDLIGILPTPAEVDGFVNDKSPRAYENLIDKLLDSPHYGERWARMWLDVARYADSTGYEYDYDFESAWRYRDYVIKAFNQDKPYDRFIKEQLAGDELWPGSPDGLVATGFNRHYPDESNARNLRQRRQEILNDITDTVGAVFLGTTYACARCHDHKFDPVLQKDYYKLQAFFAAARGKDDFVLVSA